MYTNHNLCKIFQHFGLDKALGFALITCMHAPLVFKLCMYMITCMHVKIGGWSWAPDRWYSYTSKEPLFTTCIPIDQFKWSSTLNGLQDIYIASSIYVFVYRSGLYIVTHILQYNVGLQLTKWYCAHKYMYKLRIINDSWQFLQCVHFLLCVHMQLRELYN